MLEQHTQRGHPDPLVKEATTAIRTATDSASQLTSHLLAFSRSEPAKKEVVDLAEVIRLEVKTLTRLLPKNVTVVCEARTPTYVHLGRGQLQEIILNLAINARDAMPQGGRLEFRLAPVALHGTQFGLPAGNYAQLEISDTGQGMDAATRERIFEPFFTTKQSGQGTGLGLAMVYGLVTAASGNIAVRSEPGRGTCFTLHLPETTPAMPSAQPERQSIMASNRCRVLVAENQPEIRLLLERILSGENFPIVAVADGDKAVAALQVEGSKFGLLLVAGIMPGAPTTRIIELALNRNPECQVIIMSAVPKDPRLVEKLLNNVCHELPKPFDAGQLREAVNLALSSKRGGTSIDGAPVY